jgi:hypothetical protein
VRKNLSPVKIILLAILGLFLTAALALALTDLVRNLLAEPLTRLYYFFVLLVKSTPQAVFWAILLLFLLVVAGKSVQEVKTPDLPEFDTPLRSPKRERVGFWAIHINMALQGDHYSRARLAEFLSGVALDLFAQEERASVAEVRQRLDRGELDLPPEIENYLKARLASAYTPRPGLWRMAQEKLARLWNSITGKYSPGSRTLPDQFTGQELERVIQYLEDRLEIEHGN